VNVTRYYQRLKGIEWAGMTDHGSASCCPECHAYPPNENERSTRGFGLHEPGCTVGSVLREIEEKFPEVLTSRT
jgi:hypothetical protein